MHRIVIRKLVVYSAGVQIHRRHRGGNKRIDSCIAGYWSIGKGEDVEKGIGVKIRIALLLAILIALFHADTRASRR